MDARGMSRTLLTFVQQALLVGQFRKLTSPDRWVQAEC